MNANENPRIIANSCLRCSLSDGELAPSHATYQLPLGLDLHEVMENISGLIGFVRSYSLINSLPDWIYSKAINTLPDWIYFHYF